MKKRDYEEKIAIITKNGLFAEFVDEAIEGRWETEECLPSEANDFSISDTEIKVAVCSLWQSDDINELISNINHLRQKGLIVLVLSECPKESQAFKTIEKIAAIGEFPPAPQYLVHWLIILFWKLICRKREEEAEKELKKWSRQMGPLEA